MNTITITDAKLLVEPMGLDKLWTLKSVLSISLDNVQGATYDPGATADPKGIRHPGLHLPGKWSGTFTHDGETSFWNVSGHDKTIVIQLKGEHYERLYLSVNDPRAVTDEINSALGRPQS